MNVVVRAGETRRRHVQLTATIQSVTPSVNAEKGTGIKTGYGWLAREIIVGINGSGIGHEGNVYGRVDDM